MKKVHILFLNIDNSILSCKNFDNFTCDSDNDEKSGIFSNAIFFCP